MSGIYEMERKVKYEKALVIFEKAFDNYNRTGEYDKALDCLNSIGTCYFYLGKPASAIDYFDMVADAKDRKGDYPGMTEALENAAETYLHSYCDYENSIGRYQEVVQISHEHQMYVNEARGLFKIGRLSLRRGLYSDAFIYLLRAKSIWENQGRQNLTAVVPVLMEYYLYNDDFENLFEAFHEYLSLIKTHTVDDSGGYGYLVYGKALYRSAIDMFFDTRQIKEIEELTGLKSMHWDYLNKGMKIAKKYNNIDSIISGYCFKAIVQAGENKHHSSVLSLRRAAAIDNKYGYNSLVLQNTRKLIGEVI